MLWGFIFIGLVINIFRIRCLFLKKGGIIVNHIQILTIRHNVVCELQRLNEMIPEISDLKWDDIVDRNVYVASKIGMRMIYSNKFETCKTCGGSGAFKYDSIDKVNLEKKIIKYLKK